MKNYIFKDLSLQIVFKMYEIDLKNINFYENLRMGKVLSWTSIAEIDFISTIAYQIKMFQLFFKQWTWWNITISILVLLKNSQTTILLQNSYFFICMYMKSYNWHVPLSNNKFGTFISSCMNIHVYQSNQVNIGRLLHTVPAYTKVQF